MPGVVPEEGLADAHEFLQSEWESLRRRGALISDEELFRHFVRKFGPPDDVAASYAQSAGTPLEQTGVEAASSTAPMGGSALIARRSKHWRLAMGVLALTGAAAALCGALAWTNLTQSSEGLEFISHQGVIFYFPHGKASFADSVVSFQREPLDDGRSTDAQAALGIPDCPNNEREEPETSYVALGDGGELAVEFTDNVLVDGEGPDLAIFEIGARLESVYVAVSEDGQTWLEVGKTIGRVASLDLAPLGMPNGRFRFVRVADTKRGQSNDSPWPGADIDAIGAIHSAPYQHPAPDL
jgi:hypothetical protein